MKSGWEEGPQFMSPCSGEREISSPVRVEAVGGRVSVASSRLLLFNRVAKVIHACMMMEFMMDAKKQYDQNYNVITTTMRPKSIF